MSQYTPPAGYRYLEDGEIIREGDLYCHQSEYPRSKGSQVYTSIDKVYGTKAPVGSLGVDYLIWRKKEEKDMQYKIGQRVVIKFANVDTTGVILASFYTGDFEQYTIRIDKSYYVHDDKGSPLHMKLNYLTIHSQYIKALPEIKTVKLTKDYSAVVTENGIDVGCQHVPFDKFDELAKAVKEIRS